MLLRGVVLFDAVAALLIGNFGFGIGQGCEPSAPGANC